MTKLEAYIAESKKGLVCLVPRKEAITKDSMLLSSHEKTLCDCEVLKLIAVIEKLKEALENVDSLELGVRNIVNSISRKALAIDPENK